MNNILNQRVNDPPSLNKGGTNKAWCYETIEIVVLDNVEEFMKRHKRSYDIENTNFSQPNFPINHLMFAFNQFKLAESFEDKDEYKRLKIRFHVVLGKSEEEVWSLVKIVKVISIVPDVLFQGLM